MLPPGGLSQNSHNIVGLMLVCAYVSGGQRSVLNVIPQELSSLLFKTVCLTRLEFTNSANLA